MGGIIQEPRTCSSLRILRQQVAEPQHRYISWDAPSVGFAPKTYEGRQLFIAAGDLSKSMTVCLRGTVVSTAVAVDGAFYASPNADDEKPRGCTDLNFPSLRSTRLRM